MHLLADALQYRESPEDDKDPARHSDLVVVHDLLQALYHILNARLAHIQIGIVLYQIIQIVDELPHVGDMMLHCQLDHAVGHLAGVIAGHGDEDSCEGILILLHQLAYHTKVEQDDHTILAHQDIARMRIAVEVAKLKDHRQVDIHPLLYDQLRIDVPLLQLLHIRDLAALHVLHDQDLVR